MLKYFIEIKNRLILLIFNWSFVFVVCYSYKEIILFFIMEPYLIDNNYSFIFTNIVDIFNNYFELLHFVTNQLFFIFVVIQFLKFVSPGLYYFEYKFLNNSYTLFLIIFMGLIKIYNKFILPNLLGFFLKIDSDIQKLNFHFEAKIVEYTKFYKFFYFAFIIIFQLFLIFFFYLSFINLNKKILKFFRKFIYLISFFILTTITPPDVLSQISLFIIFVIFFEGSILINYLIKKFN